MFFIFKITPDWIWWILPGLGLLGFFASDLITAKPQALVIKSLMCMLVAIGIFILGMLYSDNTWKSAARELEAKVVQLQAQSEAVNATIKEKIVFKTQTVKTRGETVLKYIDREVSNQGCTVSSEFIQAHNQAAQK